MASGASGLSDLDSSAGIPSISWALPELSTVGLRGIWSRTVGSTVNGLFSRLLKCSLHLLLMLFFSPLNRVKPSADRSCVVLGFADP